MGCPKLHEDWRFVSAGTADVEKNPFLFSSEYLDSETNLVYYNYRYYSPEIGRWTKRDSIEEDGGFNVYGFVDNDGVNRWDRVGLFDPEAELAYAIGGVWNAFTDLFSSSSVSPYDAQFKKLNCILKGLMEFVKNTGTAKIDKLLGGASDDFPYNWNTYTQPAAQYYLDNYSSADDWTVANLSNVPFVGTGDGLNLFSLYIKAVK
jgi:RHS repeat-associated protein